MTKTTGKKVATKKAAPKKSSAKKAPAKKAVKKELSEKEKAQREANKIANSEKKKKVSSTAKRPKKNATIEQTSSLLDAIVAGMQDKKAKNITIINLSGLENRVCDYFVICNGNSNTQVNAIVGSIQKIVSKELKEEWRLNGNSKFIGPECLGGW